MPKDIYEYTCSVHAGRVINSSELRRVLSAGEVGTVYPEIVSCIISFLTEPGKDSVKVGETQEGMWIVVFTDEFVRRVVAYHNQSNNVVTERRVTG